MNNPRLSSSLLALFFLVVAALACGGSSNETEQANKLVDQGNAAVQDAKKFVADAEAKKDEMLKTDVSRLAQARVTAGEAIAAYDKAKEKCKEAAQKYDEASRMQISDKFKEYLVLKSKEWNKRAEMIETAKDTPQALIDSTNRSSFINRANANNEKVTKLNKEADDFAGQADKLQKDNPTMFKS